MQVLLVEDDQSLAAGLKVALGREGFGINHVSRGRDALHVIDTAPPDLIILDLGLPDMDGIDVLQQVGGRVPVLILTARSTLDDRVKGLHLGADDYLSKPFEMPELVARLRVMERRLSTTQSPQIGIGNIVLNPAAQQVTLAGEEVEMPRREYMVLKSLMENAGKVLTRDSLESKLYSWGEEVASNAIEVHIHHLRKKLGSDFIKTIRGVGYTIKKT